MTAQTAFSIHAVAYWAARQAYENHRVECQVPLSDDDPRQSDYDSAYTPLVSAMHDAAVAAVHTPAATAAERSEEHTSELQSLMRISYAVFCLKKTKIH